MQLQFIMALFYLYALILGLVVGSFLNVIIYRLPIGISIAKGRSFCPNCQAPIKWSQNIPIISYLTLKGKCKNCGSPIAIRYPLVEGLTGILSMVSFFVFGPSLAYLVVFVITAILVAITFIDFDTQTIPNELVIALMVPAIISAFIFPELNLFDRAIGIVSVSIPMLLLTMMIPDAFGGGDIKLMAVAGFLLGWVNTLLATFIALVIGGTVAIFYIAQKRKDKHMAFGPYLCIGIYLSLHFGSAIIDWYLNIFGL
ncbi:MAG: leader peptidase (prepilin peptidase) / N-methyltransferase [Acetobacterium sp.]|nr:leader peptidase (prepilin peptidase) / N-methyltransferase [Acetobacterium sp.]